MKRLPSTLIVFWLIVCGSLAPPSARATNPHSGSRPLDELYLPRTPQERVPTSLRLSFPNNQGIPPGPSQDEASKAARDLPFTLAMVSDLDSYPAPPSTQAPLALHGRFGPGMMVAVLSGDRNAFCPALTGKTIPTENIYGASFTATSLDFLNPAPPTSNPSLPRQASQALITVVFRPGLFATQLVLPTSNALRQRRPALCSMATRTSPRPPENGASGSP